MPAPLISAIFLGSIIALIEAGDREFHEIHYGEAISYYDSALAGDSDNPELLWKLARVHVTLGEVAPDHDREVLYRKAEAYASRCIEVDSMLAEGHTWRAAALGNIALFVGGKTKIRLANEIKCELNRSLELRDDDDVTWSILGSFYFSVGEVSWFERQLASIFLGTVPEGGFEESEQAFLRAIELNPEASRHRFELGKLYMAWDREEEGRAMFRSALELPITAAGDTAARRVMIEALGEN